MPIEVGIWRLGEKLQRVSMSSLETESKLEDVLAADITILSPKLMLLGRQVLTAYGKFIDLLAMDAEGNLAVIELKRNRTPREVVAQLLDYGSWVKQLSYDQIAAIYGDGNAGKQLETGFAERFGSEATPPENLNQSHQLIVVASELDPSTERIIDYLADNYGVPVNAVFFRYFKENSHEYLTRTWLIDPDEAEIKVSNAGRTGGEIWNGRDFQVNIGADRNWEDCRRFGYIYGGGGQWYSQPLDLLFPGSRLFAYIPQAGYVGVGVVKETSKPVKDFKVEVNGQLTPILDAPVQAKNLAHDADDPELCEYLVRVEWLKAVPKEQAYWEKGLFCPGTTTSRLRNRFTLERLTKHFGLDD